MADRRTKIVLASAVMVSAIGGSLMFLRPSGTGQSAADVATPAPGPSIALRHRIDQAGPVPGVSHLLGSIEPDAMAAAAPKSHVAPVRTATNRQAFEVGELPAPSSALQAGLGTPPGLGQAPQAGWSPVHNHADHPLRHRVREGDTLSGLARYYLGSADRYAELFAANQQLLADPDHLRVGMELLIPSRSGNGRDSSAEFYRPASTAQAQSPAEQAPSSEVQSPAAMVPISPGTWRRSRQGEVPARSYRVRADDTLVDIAKQFYGDGSKFQDLYEANRDQLSSPDQLHEGLLLVIP